MFVPTRALLDDILGIVRVDHSGATHPLLPLSMVHLLKAPTGFTVSSVLADLAGMEADFNTYAAQAVGPFSSVFVGEGGMSLIEGASWHVQMTDAVKPNTIYGYYLVDAGGTVLLGGEIFDTARPLATVLDAFTLLPRFGFDSTGLYGAAVIG